MIKNIIKGIKNPIRVAQWLYYKLAVIKNSEKEFIAAPKNRSDSDDGLYVIAVKDATESYKSFTNFKRHPDYNRVLEHLTERDGLEYLEILRRQAPDLLSSIALFKDNDLLGNPRTYSYDVGQISPTTLRYIKVASDLRILFGPSIGDNIVEIGIGYAGQALIIDRIFKVLKYRLIDLPPVCDLASKCLEHHILSCSYQTSTINRESGTEEFDLVISNYAFSELPAELQLCYVKKILSKAKRGYLTMNSGLGKSPRSENKLSLAQLRAMLPPSEVIPDLPIKHDENYIIVWGHNKLP